MITAVCTILYFIAPSMLYISCIKYTNICNRLTLKTNSPALILYSYPSRQNEGDYWLFLDSSASRAPVLSPIYAPLGHWNNPHPHTPKCEKKATRRTVESRHSIAILVAEYVESMVPGFRSKFGFA